ncbi:MAG: hypothetical protein JNL11_20545 [Bdellovibrionaceae bacterium]|nr:hypothetical protein [Pseudobdellovibrionaceae bacterium]
MDVKMVNLNGQFQVIKKSDVKSILVYKVITNPLKDVSLTQQSANYLKEVSFIKSDEKPLTGFLIQKIENLVFIFDINGKYHVIELGQLGKIITPSASQERVINFPYYKKTNFTSGDYIFCSAKETDGVAPARMLVDRIKIEDFLSSLEEGFHQLRTFEERTFYYQRPFLFQKRSRLGLVSQVSVEQPYNNFPFYMQWSSGEPYRVQTQTSLGGDRNFLSPSYENFFLVSSEVKNHFFHASFLGNLVSLSAGNEFYTYLSLDSGTKERSFFSSSLNYMALIGFDWHEFSFSFGNYYPLYLIKYKSTFFREILSSSVTPVFRLRYIKQNFKLSFLFSQNKQSISNPGDKHFSESPDVSSANLLEFFKFDSILFKSEFEYDLDPKVTLGLGLSWIKGDYQELTLMGDIHSNESLNQITYGFVQYNLSRYFSVKGYLTNYDLKKRFTFNGTSFDEDTKKLNLGGVLEFIF